MLIFFVAGVKEVKTAVKKIVKKEVERSPAPVKAVAATVERKYREVAGTVHHKKKIVKARLTEQEQELTEKVADVKQRLDDWKQRKKQEEYERREIHPIH